MLQLDFSQAAFAVNAIQHLQILGVSARGTLDEMPDTFGLRDGADCIQRPDRENGVANPTITVIPVALPTRALGQ